MIRRCLSIALLTLLAGCSFLPDWVGSEEEKKLEGTRHAILPDTSQLAIEPGIRDKVMQLPAPVTNGAWFQEQAFSPEATVIVRHLTLNTKPLKAETVITGSTPEEGVRITSGPVVVGKIIAYLDGAGVLRAHATEGDHKELWTADLARLAVPGVSASGKESGWESWFASKETFLGGNIGFAEGRIVATTVSGHVFAFELESGKLAWHRPLNVALQSAPSGRNGVVFVVTTENQTYALSQKNGETLWTHNGVPQQTKILGMPAPLALSETVLVPYSSGELVSLKQANGLKLWEENMMPTATAGALAFRFSDILAAPIAVSGRIFVSSEGRFVALEALTGNPFWEMPVTIAATPWAAGEWVFGISQQPELLAIHGGEGKVRWATKLPAFADEKNKERIRWSGPVLAGGELIVAGSHGVLKRFNPENGSEIGSVEIREGVQTTPVIADGKLWLLTGDGDIQKVE